MKEYTIIHNVQITKILTLPDSVELGLRDKQYLENVLKHDINKAQEFDDVLILETKIFELEK